MNSGTDNDSLFFLVFLKWHSIGDSEVFTLVTGNGSTQKITADIIELFLLDFFQVLGEIRICVRKGISKVNSVFVVLECVSKGKCVKAS